MYILQSLNTDPEILLKWNWNLNFLFEDINVYELFLCWRCNNATCGSEFWEKPRENLNEINANARLTFAFISFKFLCSIRKIFTFCLRLFIVLPQLLIVIFKILFYGVCFFFFQLFVLSLKLSGFWKSYNWITLKICLKIITTG